MSQLVGTDHCTFNSTQKGLGIDDFRKIPNGVNGKSTVVYSIISPDGELGGLNYCCPIPGLEERMHLVWDTMVVS